MNKKVCIIVGHGKSKSGEYDSGAVSRDGKHQEFLIAREIAKSASDYLGCELMNYNGDLYLTDRIRKVNSGDYDFVAEIHLNAGGGKGVEVYYYHDSPTGLRVSDEICKEIVNTLSVENRGPKVRVNKNGKDYFAIIRDTRPTAILVETVFIDYASDLAKVKTQEGQKKCGEAIGRAIERAFGGQKNKIRVTVSANSLNIRSGAGKNFDVVGYAQKGQVLEISETAANNSWGRISGTEGWISLNPNYVRRM